MSKKLARFKPDIFATGLRLGYQILEKPLWNDARNLLFDGVGVKAEKGFAQLAISSVLFDDHAGLFDAAAGLFDDGGGTVTPLDIGATDKITGLLQRYTAAAARQVTVGTATKLYWYSGGTTTTEGTGFTAAADESEGVLATYWSMINYGDWVIATNGREKIKINKGLGAGFVDLAGTMATKAEVIRKIGAHALIFNTSNGYNSMEWCKFGDPEVWNPATDPTAGQLLIQELQNPIICAEPLGNLGLGVHTRSEMIAVQYLGGTFTFGQRLAQKGIGAASKNSIVPVGGLQYGISPVGVWRTDGTSLDIVSAKEDKLGTWLERNVNWSQQSKIAGYHSLANRTIKWTLPSLNAMEPDLVLLFNYSTGEFGLSDQVFTVGLEASVLGYPVVGRSGGRVDLAEFGNNDRTAPISRWVETKPLNLDNSQIWKYVDFLLVQGKINSGAGPQCYARALPDTKDSTLAATAWEGPFTLTDANTKFNLRVNGPYIQFRFASTALNENWELAAFEPWGAPSGGDW